jgi:hypothetical protein
MRIIAYRGIRTNLEKDLDKSTYKSHWDSFYDNIKIGKYFSSSLETAKTYGKVVIKALLELKNPYIADFEGHSWNFYEKSENCCIEAEYKGRKSSFDFIFNLNKEKLPIEIKRAPSSYKSEKEAKDDLDFRLSLLKKYNLLDEDLKYSIVKEGPIDIDELTVRASNDKYDGCIFKNVRDTYIGNVISKLISTTYVIFSPNQMLKYSIDTFDEILLNEMFRKVLLESYT